MYVHVCYILDHCTGSDIQDAYLLFTDFNSINKISLNGSDQHTVVSNVVNIHGLDFDILTNMVYWCDIDEGKIYRANINCDGRELIISDLINPEQLAIDWISKKLYWCDSGRATIEYSNLNGSDREVLLNETVDQPHGIAVDAFWGYIYWTDWGATPKIEKMTIFGKNRHVIVSTNLATPNDLTIDYMASKLFWVDTLLGKVEMSDLEGRGRSVLLNAPHPYGISVYNDIIYWTDWITQSVSLVSDDNRTAHNLTFGIRPSSIHVVHYSAQYSTCEY